MNKNNKNFCAVLLCGGLGTRISSITKTIPKPMIKVFNKPLIFYSIEALLKSKVSKIILPLGYKGQIIENYVKKKYKKDLSKFLLIKTGRNTSIFKRIIKVKTEIKKYKSFLLLNSDTIFNFELNKLIEKHIKSKNKITVSTSIMKTSWGTFECNKKNEIVKFSKNNYLQNYKLVDSNMIGIRNSGIAVIETNCLDNLSDKEKDFELNLYSKFINKKKIGLHIFNNKFWEPVETLSDLNMVKNNLKLKNYFKKNYEKYTS
jgi:D-glycero-alpha-D-manno-heptose 1-phosphate guanylyltransferase